MKKILFIFVLLCVGLSTMQKVSAQDGGTADGMQPQHAEGRVPDLFSGGGDAGVAHQPQRSYASPVRPEVRYVERPQRQITEIRVYFDDLTYESFVPKK